MNKLKFSQIPAVDKGRATTWAAKGLLGKVYLTLNRKTEAITQLQDVVTNSGYSLVTTGYADVFATDKEMNSEILFTVRYKAGGFGLGSSFGNDFGPLGSVGVINGSPRGWNTPSTNIDSILYFFRYKKEC